MIPFLLSGSVLGAIDVLGNFLRPLGAQTIVPGHGPVGGPELLEPVLGYLRFIVRLACGPAARRQVAARPGALYPRHGWHSS